MKSAFQFFCIRWEIYFSESSAHNLALSFYMLTFEIHWTLSKHGNTVISHKPEGAKLVSASWKTAPRVSRRKTKKEFNTFVDKKYSKILSLSTMQKWVPRFFIDSQFKTFTYFGNSIFRIGLKKLPKIWLVYHIVWNWLSRVSTLELFCLQNYKESYSLKDHENLLRQKRLKYWRKYREE